jgi:outer membrane protein assembly factor BamB
MKKWLKWTLGIIGLLVLIIVTFVAWNWSTFTIVAGTEELSGDTSAIPQVTGTIVTSVSTGASDWPSWYGPDGDRRSPLKGIITDWSGGLKKQWEVNYLCQGAGSASWSAPVIQGNRLVVSGRDTANDLVFCLHPKDGKLLWYRSYPTKAQNNHGSGPRATPFIDQDRVYTFGRNGDLACWNLNDGEEIWRKSVKDEGGEEPMWGYASSPLVLGDRVYVQAGGSSRTIAYDKMTGEVIWKSGNGVGGYAALQIVNINDNLSLLTFHGNGLAAVNVEDGKEVWNIRWETEYDVNATTPVGSGNRVLITSGYGTGSTLLKVDGEGANSLWRIDAFSSIHSDPTIVDGYIYGYSGDSFQNKGAFKCIDISNGQEKWTTNDMGWGTSVFVDGYILCCDIKGNLFLMKPSPDEFVKITELADALGDIRGPVWTTPVVSNGKLYVRFKQKLICYDIVG